MKDRSQYPTYVVVSIVPFYDYNIRLYIQPAPTHTADLQAGPEDAPPSGKSEGNNESTEVDADRMAATRTVSLR